MIEVTVLQYLNSELDVPAYMERPDDPPASFVLIEKTGSSKRNQIKHSTFAVQSISNSLANAATLNENVVEIMENMIELSDICSVDSNSDYNFPNTQRKEYRYQAVFDITHY